MLKRFVSVVLFLPVLFSGCRTRDSLRGDLPKHETAFVGANVVSIEPSQVFLDQTVVVRDGRIARVGDRRAVHPSGDAHIIDARGLFLIPGLTEMHAHLPAATDAFSLDDYLFLYLARGVTTVRAMRGDRQQLARRNQIAAGEAEGPNLIVSSPYLTDDDDFTVAKARVLAAEYSHSGYDFIKLLGGFKPEMYEEVIAAATDSGMRVMGHVPKAVGLERAIEAGQADVEHIDPLLQLVHEHPQDVDRVIRRMAERGVSTCPDVYWYVVNFGLRPLDELRRDTRGLEFVPPGVVAEWTAELEKNQSDPAKALPKTVKYRQEVATYLSLLPRMNAAGVRLLSGAGDGAFIVPGFSLLEELRLFERAGLSKAAILRIATRNAAESEGKQKEWGTIMEGSRADLVLLERNPLADLSNLDRIAGVMVRGGWMSRAEIDRRLEKMKRLRHPES